MKDAKPTEAITAIDQVCLVCGTGESSRVLLACKFQNEDRWVCVKCLPRLIHGPDGCGH